MNLKGKIAVVTGSTSGIGHAIANRLAESGCNIVLNGFGDAEKIEQERQRLSSECAIDVLYNGADLSDPHQIEGLFADVIAHFGGVDILINNAGIQFVSPIEDFPLGKWDQIMAINLTAPFILCRAVVPPMRAAGWGRIVNIASVHGMVASPFKSAYVAAKHGLCGLTKVVALEVAEQNITCNAICPGYVWTPLVEGQIADTAAARGISEDQVKNDVLLAAQPTKKFIKRESIAEYVVFLCSDAAQNITGAMLPMGGGWLAE